METNYNASLQKNNDNANGTRKKVSSNLHEVDYLKRSKKVARNLP